VIDKIEFYQGNRDFPFAHVASSFRMNKGDLISICKVTWRVVEVSFALDDSAGPTPKMRCNVTVVEVPRG
jgi:hypothetical protein